MKCAAFAYADVTLLNCIAGLIHAVASFTVVACKTAALVSQQSTCTQVLPSFQAAA